MTQPKTDLAYLRNEKAKAEQKLRSCQHREKILERQMSELNRRERVHRLCTRAGMLESFLVCPGELTDDQVMELLKKHESQKSKTCMQNFMRMYQRDFSRRNVFKCLQIATTKNRLN